MRVRVWVGDRFEEQERVGGTQKIDGFFAAFRKVVGKRSFNTVGSSDEKGPRMEQIMCFHVRLFSCAIQCMMEPSDLKNTPAPESSKSCGGKFKK